MFFYSGNYRETSSAAGKEPPRRVGGVQYSIAARTGICKIPVIKNGQVLNREAVCSQYQKVHALQTKSLESRGWLFDILKCVEKLNHVFTLREMYGFSGELKIKHPRNHNIEAKIRQQLQFLRDKGIIEFMRPGQYRKIITT